MIFFNFLLTCESWRELLPGNGEEDLLLYERLHANNFHTANNIGDFIISLISICFEFGINFCIVVHSAFSNNPKSDSLIVEGTFRKHLDCTPKAVFATLRNG